ncbi:hypothetical protein PM082_021062 [Marasmius tenuissimus]|nr:hypothetical protein PM082_021062 [Marasmius tenuissimus]
MPSDIAIPFESNHSQYETLGLSDADLELASVIHGTGLFQVSSHSTPEGSEGSEPDPQHTYQHDPTTSSKVTEMDWRIEVSRWES